ncbi:ABC transporter ATP-binding protein [Roseicella aerolata]|uniref:ATP-binding cassette domain-containing protein n=1 Tax=Roseicella aerolata TaxID=2883479 RepID=A0A9X1IKH0_9PROT|nr:ATP-binding cassette domain-containing protein [Roseicella aerolata]MCB4825288.1 ATP-binding cassette domain-containing protein [Roseicella aerolata]
MHLSSDWTRGDAPAAGWELDEAGFTLGDRALVGPLTLRLEPGQVHGLIGPNGSGKSTLLRLLGRQLAPTSGRIGFGGRPIAAWRARDFARQVAYLPQALPASDGMTVRELAALGRYPWHGALGRHGPRDRMAVEDALRRAGVAAFALRQADSLSGGERQRAWLAMLLAQEARFLLLDEPTSALDLAHQAEILGLIRRLAREQGLGIVVVLHDVNMAARHCDTILALSAGRLLLRGAPAEVMQPAVLEGLYRVPMGILPHPATGEPIGYLQ